MRASRTPQRQAVLLSGEGAASSRAPFLSRLPLRGACFYPAGLRGWTATFLPEDLRALTVALVSSTLSTVAAGSAAHADQFKTSWTWVGTGEPEQGPACRAHGVGEGAEDRAAPRAVLRDRPPPGGCLGPSCWKGTACRGWGRPQVLRPSPCSRKPRGCRCRSGTTWQHPSLCPAREPGQAGAPGWSCQPMLVVRGCLVQSFLRGRFHRQVGVVGRHVDIPGLGVKGHLCCSCSNAGSLTGSGFFSSFWGSF